MSFKGKCIKAVKVGAIGAGVAGGATLLAIGAFPVLLVVGTGALLSIGVSGTVGPAVRSGVNSVYGHFSHSNDKSHNTHSHTHQQQVHQQQRQQLYYRSDSVNHRPYNRNFQNDFSQTTPRYRGYHSTNIAEQSNSSRYQRYNRYSRDDMSGTTYRDRHPSRRTERSHASSHKARNGLFGGMAVGETLGGLAMLGSALSF